MKDMHSMEIKVKKSGDSLMLRIPKLLANELGLLDDSQVELSIIDKKLVIAPVLEHELSLEKLMAKVTKDNLHSEVDTGIAVGKEIW